MKIVVFGSERRVGALVDEQIVDLHLASATIPQSLRGFVEGGQRTLDEAQRVIDARGSAPDGAVLQARDVRLLAPWPERRIACVGGNYADHLAGMESGE